MAYYSNQGANIYSGAAGLGSMNHGPLMAFQDGSLGSTTVQVSPGVRYNVSIVFGKAVRDAAVERLRAEYARNGSTFFRVRRSRGTAISATTDVVASRAQTVSLPAKMTFYSIVSITPVPGMKRKAASGFGDSGMLRAYQDGSLGNDGTLTAYKDGSLGEAPIRSYQDGSLGYPLFVEDEKGIRELDTPVTITHAPMGEYFTGMAGCGTCGLGVDSAGLPTLDLNDAAAMRELKIAMGALLAGSVHINEFPIEFYSDPSWGEQGTKLATYWWAAAVNIMTLALATTKGSALTSEEVGQITEQIGKGLVSPSMYPNALGVTNVVALAGSAGVPVPPDQMPKLVAFSTAAKAAASADGVPQGNVVPPGKALQANMLAMGVGAVAIGIALYLVFKKKR